MALLLLHKDWFFDSLFCMTQQVGVLKIKTQKILKAVHCNAQTDILRIIKNTGYMARTNFSVRNL